MHQSPLRSIMRSYDHSSIKRRQNANSIELRREKRADIVFQARKLTTPDKVMTYSRSDLPELFELLKSHSKHSYLLAIQGFHYIFQSNPWKFKKILENKLIEHLKQWVQDLDFQNKTLFFIVSITEFCCTLIVNNGFIPLLIPLLDSNNVEILNQTLCVFGNIAGDSPENRDFLINSSILEKLVRIFKNSSELTTIKNLVWVVSNICKNVPTPGYELVKKMTPFLAESLVKYGDLEIITECLWALVFITEANWQGITDILKLKLSKKVIELLKHKEILVVLPAVKLIGNIAAGDQTQISKIVKHKVIKALCDLLQTNCKKILKETLWVISNICADGKLFLDELISTETISSIVKFANSTNLGIKKEAVWALGNVSATANPSQLEEISKYGLIEVFCQLISETDVKIISISLESLKKFLESVENSPTFPMFLDLIEYSGGFSRIETLQLHKNPIISQKSSYILDNFFS